MKNRLRIISSLIVGTMILAACDKDELMSFEGKDSVYFYTNAVAGSNKKDSTNVYFAYMSPTITDSVVSIAVQVMGRSASIDRSFAVEVSSNSTAIEGIHYEALPPSFVIPADSIAGYVKIKCLRSPDLASSKVQLNIKLRPNEYFETSMLEVITNTTTKAKLSTVDYRIFMTDELPQPYRWSDYYFGVFSRKKCLLICELNATTPAFLNGEMINGKTVQLQDLASFATVTQRYLEKQKAAGTPVREDDGSVMTMGNFVFN